MGEIRKDTVVRGLLEHANIRDYRSAETILDRLIAVTQTDNFLRILQRLNSSRHNRCPCCGFKTAWNESTPEPDFDTVMQWLPGENE